MHPSSGLTQKGRHPAPNLPEPVGKGKFLLPFPQLTSPPTHTAQPSHFVHLIANLSCSESNKPVTRISGLVFGKAP